MSSDDFYSELEFFDEFVEVADIDNYLLAPEDWFVVIADVRASTKAIEAGRYKEVNMVGAACINAVLNISESGHIPYVFGGDGATLLVPANSLNHCQQVLLGVQQLADTSFGLDLRVGVVPVSTIHASAESRVRVGKYQLSPGNVVATFSGGGIELAERWIKTDSRYLLLSSDQDAKPDLSGLSCRWEPLASEQGVILSLLMQADGDDEVENANLYRELIGELERLTQGTEVKPVTSGNMQLRWPPRGLGSEIALTVGDRNRFLYICQMYFYSAFQWVLNRFDLSAAGYHAKEYRAELRNNTDYRRFDDTLRILLDCSLDQAEQIESMLKQREQAGKLHYGVHRSDSALMTCLVFNLEQGQHIHFVDGSNGGFTSAAKNLKMKR